MDDLISRAEAIDALKRKQDDGKGDLSRFYNTIIQHDIEAIMQLPPIQPKPLQPWEVLVAQAVLPFLQLCREERGDNMNIDLEKDIVQSLSSLYPLQEFEERAIDTVLDAIPHWIPVTERLPEEEDSIFARYYGTDGWRKTMFRKKSREVIVTSVFENGELHTEVAHTTDGKWYVGVNVVPRTVIAWQPLPEPYKGVTE